MGIHTGRDSKGAGFRQVAAQAGKAKKDRRDTDGIKDQKMITRYFPAEKLTPTKRLRKRTAVAVLDSDFRGCKGWIYKWLGGDIYVVALHPVMLNGSFHPFGNTLRIHRRFLGYAPDNLGPAQF